MLEQGEVEEARALATLVLEFNRQSAAAYFIRAEAFRMQVSVCVRVRVYVCVCAAYFIRAEAFRTQECVRVCVCVEVCVRACVHACMHACVPACVRAANFIRAEAICLQVPLQLNCNRNRG